MIHQILEILSIIVFIDTILSYFPQIRSQKWAFEMHKMVEVLLRPIRQILPRDMALDPSPMILIMVIQILKMLI